MYIITHSYIILLTMSKSFKWGNSFSTCFVDGLMDLTQSIRFGMVITINSEMVSRPWASFKLFTCIDLMWRLNVTSSSLVGKMRFLPVVGILFLLGAGSLCVPGGGLLKLISLLWNLVTHESYKIANHFNTSLFLYWTHMSRCKGCIP